MKYYPLHVHTTSGSIGDSILRVSDYVKRGIEYGLDALAITDHGSMAAMYEFNDACKQNNIKPIFGMEAYVCYDNSLKDKEHNERFHLILLARTNEGLQNLLRIHNNAESDGFYYKPRTDLAHLKQWGKGIIAMSACVAGEIPQAILNKDNERAIEIIEEYKNCFDVFALEIQPGDFEEQKLVNKGIISLARYTDTPIVMSNDIHYLNHEDAITHDYHVKLGRNADQKNFNGGMVYPDSCYWFMSYDDIVNSFEYDGVITREIVDIAIENTEIISRSCDVNLPERIFMPVFCENEDDILSEMCYNALDEISDSLDDPEVYRQRLERELRVIKDKGFCGYFLVVQDYINWARNNDIAVGPGRGSAAGSLVNYLLGISQADPIKHGLMFERFLDPNRNAIPDIDSDLAPSGRNKVFQYLIDKYGYNNCVQVSTVHIRKAKGAVRDAARILGYKPAVGNEIAKLIPTVYYGDDEEKQTDLDIKTSIEVTPELVPLQEKYPDIFDLAERLEGLPSSKGVHAGGMIISPVDLTGVVPLRHLDTKDILATELALDDAERQLVKFDLLSLSNLEIIKATEKDIGWTFNYRDESLYEDEAMWDIIGSRNTTGIFQISSKIYKDRMPRLKPRSIEELAACIALVRGPAISAHTDEVFMQICEGKRKIESIDPVYDKVMAETKGILIYQEQIVELASAYGMEMSHCYKLMEKAKKKKLAEVQEFHDEFVSCAIKNGATEASANKAFGMIENAARYSFNKSHALIYAFIVAATAYLKVHYPLQFMKNLLSNAYINSKKDEYKTILNDCRRMGIEFLPADINMSDWNFTVEDNKIRIGLCAIKGLGDKAVEELITHRPYESLEDLNDKVSSKFNIKCVNTAIFAGLFDSLTDVSRDELYRINMESRKKELINEVKLGSFSVNTDDDVKDLEEKFYGVNFIYSPTNELEPIDWDAIKNKELFVADIYIDEVKEIIAKNGKMAFVKVITSDTDIEMTVFADTYKKFKTMIKKHQIRKITARKDGNDRCILQSIAA